MNKARSTRKQSTTAIPAVTLATTPATDFASIDALDGADFIEHILVEHGQFLTLLDATRQRLQAFLDGDTTLGAIERLTDEITKALPATAPTVLATAPTSFVGGAK